MLGNKPISSISQWFSPCTFLPCFCSLCWRFWDSPSSCAQCDSAHPGQCSFSPSPLWLQPQGKWTEQGLALMWFSHERKPCPSVHISLTKVSHMLHLVSLDRESDLMSFTRRKKGKIGKHWKYLRSDEDVMKTLHLRFRLTRSTMLLASHTFSLKLKF